MSDVAEIAKVSDDEFVAHFWTKVDRRGDDECWPWLGSVIPKDRRGIAIFRERRCVAPRLAYFIGNGRWLTKAEFACHHCDNPNCVNPSHIWAGTSIENCRDAQEKGRLARQRPVCPRGHPYDLAYKTGPRKGERYCGECSAASRRRRYQRRVMLEQEWSVDEVAANLTETMRDALLYPDGYHDPNTVKALRRRGLWKSPLGLAVREHLQSPKGLNSA